MASLKLLLICLGVLGVMSVIFLAGAFTGSFLIRGKLKDGIKDQVVVDGFDSEGYWSWQNNTQKDAAPQWLNFYLWNVTNPEEILNGSKPLLAQIGPYSYRKYMVEFNVSFPKGGDERSSREWQYYLFDSEASFEGANPLEDNVTVINAPFQAVLSNLLKGERQDKWWKALAFDMIAAYSNDTLFTTAIVDNLIFHNEYPILKAVSNLQPEVSPTFQLQVNQTDIDEAYNTTQLSAMKTGRSDLKDLGQYILWKNKTSVDCWGSEAANEVKGTDGTVFPPGTDESDKPIVFVDSLFRTTQLESTSTVKHKGISLARFRLVSSAFQNATQNPNNAVYYQFGPMGVLNLTKCMNAPIFMSMPHFLNADPWYREQVGGMTPDSELHQTNIDVEPNTGKAMHATKRLQINVQLQDNILLYPNVRRNLYFPLAWIEQTGGVTDDLASKFKGAVYAAQTLEMIVLWGGFGFGAVFLLAFLIVGVLSYRIHKKRQYEYSRLVLNTDTE